MLLFYPLVSEMDQHIYQGIYALEEDCQYQEGVNEEEKDGTASSWGMISSAVGFEMRLNCVEHGSPFQFWRPGEPC
jgi:hypothetical protein